MCGLDRPHFVPEMQDLRYTSQARGVAQQAFHSKHCKADYQKSRTSDAFHVLSWTKTC